MNLTLRTIGNARFLRGLALAVPVLAMVAAFVSCESHKNSPRKESIEVYLSPLDKEPVTRFNFGVQGGITNLYVKSNVDFSVHWEDTYVSSWASVVDYSQTDPQTGYRIVSVRASKRSSDCIYTRRSGNLIFASDDASLNYNVFITGRQGSGNRISEDFSWLISGGTNPLEESGETAYDNWTAAQKRNGYTSTVGTGRETTYCYSKNGFVKLGDGEGHGADIITPMLTDFYKDSLLVVSFKAVAYVAEDGTKDNNKLIVEVLNGGVIADYEGHGWTSTEVDVPYYDLNDENFPKNMWDGSNFLVFIRGTKQNPLTTSTQIRLLSGSLTSQASTSNRIFIDDLYVYTVLEAEEEDYMALNGGSGPDRILGTPAADGSDEEVVEEEGHEEEED